VKNSRARFHWEEKRFHLRFQTGISLHSHTLHSRESMDFIGRATANTPWLSGAIRKQKEKYRALKGREVDLSRAWWTPPLSALQAWKLEKSQIENSLGLRAHVSLTDHDNIDAGLHLRLLDEPRRAPVAVEWTVPWRQTFFHLGLHNLPAEKAPGIMRELVDLTEDPVETRIGEMLDRLHSLPEVLIVFNHPLWDEGHIGAALHKECVDSFLARFHTFIHALELNGLRPWKENRDVARFAAAEWFPVISGGDRHGREPNACLNLTNAATFAEFVEEVRCDGWSDVLFMPQYREPFKLRILQNLCDIIEDDPRHSLGWNKWSDRVFYLTDEGTDKSLTELWGKQVPSVVNHFVSLMSLARHSHVQWALRYALTRASELPGD
jgi:hypothetical protein